MTPAEQFVAEDMAAERRLSAARQVLDGLARVAEGLERAAAELDREIANVRADLARRAVQVVREREPVAVHPCFEDRAFQQRWRGAQLAADVEAGHARRTQPYFQASS